MSDRLTNTIAAILLATMFFLAVFSIKDDAFTFDETAHVTAGYSYLTQKDYRLNPEHPPLIKDLAAFPLLFLNLNFPKDHPSWLQEENPVWWHQFELANQFLYHSGNNPEQILFWSRMPMILLLIFLGWFLFFWTKRLFDQKTALLALFLFSFSPTFLAHGRLVTTDVAAAFGTVISTYFWLKFLRNPSTKNIILAGLIFGLTMLFKFSLILLIPFFAFLTLIYAWIEGKKNILKYLALATLAGIIGLVFVIWPIYQYHIWNYPAERQIRDTQFLLDASSIPKPLVLINKWLSAQPIFRPISQYLLGVLLAVNRTTTGNTTYFLGEISAKGWKNYFPVVYSIKEPLPFHILTIIALLYVAWLIKKPFWQNTFWRVKNWLKIHFPEFAMLSFVILYWATSLSSNLNIGVRHLLPVFPFTMILVAATISYWLKAPFLKAKYFLLGVLIFWQIFSIVRIYPHFLSYCNQLAGGPNNCYLYVVNSNLDWGQDLKRLKKWVEENKIDKIYVDYFGGGDLKYYLKEKYLPWWGTRNPAELPKGSYLAVSANQLQGGRAFPVKGYELPSDFYNWLYRYEPPIEKIGYSIFIYRID
jgi:hypothetical protein